MAEPEIDLEVCRPVADHARLAMAWRNDPETRAASFHRAEKSWESFWPEFRDDWFGQPDLPPLFAVEAGRRIGILRFRPVASPEGLAGRSVDISIVMDPAHRGQGNGWRAVRAALPFLTAAGVDSVLAEVREDNPASLGLFRKAGFRALPATDHHVADTGETCRVVPFVADLTPAYWRRGRVFVIAEAGSNWRMGTPARDRDMGRALIDAAAVAGADAVKFQTYRAETVYVANAGASDYLRDAGIDQDIGDIFADLEMPYDLVAELAAHCRERGVAFMSTPFSAADFAAVDPHVGVHKIASYENGHVDLLRAAAGSGKPTLISTGASTPADIACAAETYRDAGGRDLCLMQCTARYPAPGDSLNLTVIPWLKRRFGAAAGLSDHSRDPVTAPVAAVALGARAIEKHFTLDNRLPGPDHAFAVLPDELTAMVGAVRTAEAAAGDGIKAVLPVEAELAAYARRGLQAIRDIRQGEVLTEGDAFAVLRPGNQPRGAEPRFREFVEGARAARDIRLGEGIAEGDWVA